MMKSGTFKRTDIIKITFTHNILELVSQELSTCHVLTLSYADFDIRF